MGMNNSKMEGRSSARAIQGRLRNRAAVIGAGSQEQTKEKRISLLHTAKAFRAWYANRKARQLMPTHSAGGAISLPVGKDKKKVAGALAMMDPQGVKRLRKLTGANRTRHMLKKSNLS